MEPDRAAVKWLVDEWAEKLAGILESMTDERPAPLADAAAEDAGPGAKVPEGALIWEQVLTSYPDPAIWIAAPEAVWQDFGSRTLRSAGMEDVESGDARNTWLEILNQSAGALAKELSRRMHADVLCGRSGEVSELPPELRFTAVQMNYAGGTLPPVYIAFSPLLIEAVASSTVVQEEVSPYSETLESSPLPQIAPQSAGISKTFDLLLEVALPVSISFGRTQLPIRDILKLTTGSIVELNRIVTEPVEVIVNDCVIARGEVVVVEGNYGVRIRQIVSRQERFRTGTMTAQRAQRPAH